MRALCSALFICWMLHGKARNRSVGLCTDSRDSLQHGHLLMRRQKSSCIQHSPIQASSLSHIFSPWPQILWETLFTFPVILPGPTSHALSALVFPKQHHWCWYPLSGQYSSRNFFLLCDVVHLPLAFQSSSVHSYRFLSLYFLVPLTYLLVICWKYLQLKYCSTQRKGGKCHNCTLLGEIHLPLLDSQTYSSMHGYLNWQHLTHDDGDSPSMQLTICSNIDLWTNNALNCYSGLDLSNWLI